MGREPNAHRSIEDQDEPQEHGAVTPSWWLGTTQHYLRDLIYGANDGIVTTFAVVSGVPGAALSNQVILILGITNLLADGFSMAASDFLSLRSYAAAREASGEELEEEEPLCHGLATFGAFVSAGAVPLLAYFLPISLAYRFPVASALTLLTLFTVGASRSLVTDRPWRRSGLEMLAVGTIAAAVAYGLGALISSLMRQPGNV